MRLTRNTRLTALKVSIIFAACLLWATASSAVTLEPNNDLTNATSIDGACTHSGLQSSAGDPDLVLLNPQAEGRMPFTLDMGPQSLPFDITIHTGEVIGGNIVIVDSEADFGITEAYSESFDLEAGQVRLIEVLCLDVSAQSYSLSVDLLDFSSVYSPNYRVLASEVPSLVTAGQPCGFDILVEERPSRR